MVTLLLATRNAHKVKEIRAILGEQLCYLTLNEYPDSPQVNEDAPDFAGNALKKSVQLAKWLRASHRSTNLSEVSVLADDSGLEVTALNGAPGVHSARFATFGKGQGGNASDAANCAKLLDLLRDVPFERRTARFRCVIALTPVTEPSTPSASPVCYADELEILSELFEGTCEGHIGFEPRGKGGFGYDPLFIPEGYEQTFAELGEEVKNKFSHRARALEKLSMRLKLG